MNTGYMQGKTQTFHLPPGGFLAAPIFAGSGPYGGHDPYLSRARGFAGLLPGVGAGSGLSGGMLGGPGAAVGAAALSSQLAYNNYRNEVAAQDATLRQGFADRLKRGTEIVDSMGKAAVADTQRVNADHEAEVKMQLSKAGLLQGGGTAVTEPLGRVADDNALRMSRTLDTIAARRLAVDAQLSGDQLGQIERVTHAPPDMGQLAALASQAGSGNTEGMEDQPQPPMVPQQGPTPEQAAAMQSQAQKQMTKEANRQASYQKSRLRKALDRQRVAPPTSAPAPAAPMAPQSWPGRSVAALPQPVINIPRPNFSNVRTLATPAGVAPPTIAGFDPKKNRRFLGVLARN